MQGCYRREYGVRHCSVSLAGRLQVGTGVSMNLVEIGTLPELAAALDQLRRGRSLSLQGLADAAAELPPRGGRQAALPRSTASDLLRAKSMPEVETLVTFLTACGIREEEAQQPWLQALNRVANQHHRCPPGAVRVRDARPRMLGVHAAIQTAQPLEAAQPVPADGELPPYVPRDFDADLHTKLTRAQHQGGFVLLVGDSSVGKTRALFETVQAVLPDWWLLHPRDAGALREFAAHPTGRTVVWLDELQDYLDFPGGVPAGQVRELIAAGVVLVATCWPGEHNKRRALPKDGQPDPYANDRRLLDLADVLHVPAAFSSHERRRAEELASTDRRIRIALDTSDAGFTQVMAAGPELIRHWTQAPAYAKAVITAALDARRVGAHAPLTRDYLTDATPGYLNEREVATAPPDWLEKALAYATRLLHGATAALTPVSAGMGAIAGYQVADYLHQYALHARRREHLPDTVWHALVRRHHPDDTGRLADKAERRGRDHEAFTLYQRLADRGDEYASRRLAELLAAQGHVEQLRARADNGDEYAPLWLAARLAKQGKMEELLTRADNHDKYAAAQLADLLAKQGHVEQLRSHADNGDEYAAVRLADLLAAQGRIEDAIQVLRAHTDNGSKYAAYRLADLLADQGQFEDTIQVMRAYGGEHGVSRLAQLLTEHGQIEDAIQVLRAHADNGDVFATRQLTDLLADQGRFDDAIQMLRAHADNGHAYAAARLAPLLAKQGQMEELLTRADNHDKYAAAQLADLLAKQGHVEQLRTRADNGDGYATCRLAELLAEHGQFDDALQMLRARADNGDQYAAGRLVELLAKQGQVEQLCERADNGDQYAANRLIDLLTKEERVKDLEREVAAGTRGAVAALHRVRSHVSSRGD
jgi:predicted negative regulator of RcsB-dependent stress response